MKSQRRIKSENKRAAVSATKLLLLPAGEGRDEGEQDVYYAEGQECSAVTPQ
jgi:hypothetical protein